MNKLIKDSRRGFRVNTINIVKLESGEPSLVCTFCRLYFKEGFVIANAMEECRPVKVCRTCMTSFDTILGEMLNP